VISHDNLLLPTIAPIPTYQTLAVLSIAILALSYIYSFVSTMPTSTHTPQPPILYSFNASSALIDSLAEFIIKAQAEAIEKRQKFTLALSGGSLPKMLKGLVGRRDIAWDKWYVYTNVDCRKFG
jgi:hypothetical protein